MLIQINKENSDLFIGVTSEESYELLRSSLAGKFNLVGLGACDENGLITGCLMCEIIGETEAELSWIYVREPSRRMGFGREMLDLLKNSLKSIGITQLSTLYTDEKTYSPENSDSDSDGDASDLKGFLAAMNFESKMVSNDFYRLTLSDLRDACPKGVSKGISISPVSTIPSHKILAYVKEHIAEENPSMQLIKYSGIDSFAPCSLACMNGTEIDALSLLIEREDGLGVNLVYCDTEDITKALAMIDRASKEALLTYKRSGIMSFTTLDGNGSKLIKALKCPGFVTEVYQANCKL